MKIIENGIYYYTRESDAKEGFSVIPPPGYDINKKYEVWYVVHGNGEKGSGDLESLKNVTLGYDYDGPTGPLPRQYPIASQDFRRHCAENGQIGVIVNYPSNFDPTDFDYVMNTVEADFSVDGTKSGVIGFSWGGREVYRFITSSVNRAKRLAVAIMAAPVNPGGNAQNVIDAELQCIVTTYQEDPTVSPSNAKAIVAALKASKFPPYYIEFPGKAHGGFSEMLTASSSLVPQSMYNYLETTSTVDRKPYPSSKVVEPPVVLPPPTTTAKAVASYTGTGPSIRLIGDKSIGWKTGYEASWSFVTGPAGVTSKQVFPGGSSFINATANLPVQGTYVFRLTLSGAPVPADVTVVYGSIVQPVPKVVESFDSSIDLITYTDKTTEIGRSIYEGGKWKIISASGVPYNL